VANPLLVEVKLVFDLNVPSSKDVCLFQALVVAFILAKHCPFGLVSSAYLCRRFVIFSMSLDSGVCQEAFTF